MPFRRKLGVAGVIGVLLLGSCDTTSKDEASRDASLAGTDAGIAAVNPEQTSSSTDADPTSDATSQDTTAADQTGSGDSTFTASDDAGPHAQGSTTAATGSDQMDASNAAAPTVVVPSPDDASLTDTSGPDDSNPNISEDGSTVSPACAEGQSYFEPGCSETDAEFAPGCYAPCGATSSCPDGSECRRVIVDPCVCLDSDVCCAACGAEQELCMPSGEPDGGVEACDFLDDVKACTIDDDCKYAEHQIDCCGTLVVVGFNSTAGEQFARQEAACQDSYPMCRCAERETSTEDGVVVDSARRVDVVCAGGMCQTQQQPANACGDLTCSTEQVCVVDQTLTGPKESLSYRCEANPCEGGLACSCASSLCEAGSRICQIPASAGDVFCQSPQQ